MVYPGVLFTQEKHPVLDELSRTSKSRLFTSWECIELMINIKKSMDKVVRKWTEDFFMVLIVLFLIIDPNDYRIQYK